MTIGKYSVNVSKETMWGAGILLTVGALLFIYNRNKNKSATAIAQASMPINTAVNYSTAYRHAVELQMQELSEKGITKINLADPTTWPAYK